MLVHDGNCDKCLALQDSRRSRYVRSDALDKKARGFFHGPCTGAGKISSLGAKLPGYITQVDV